jgi:WD40 repeat protein
LRALAASADGRLVASLGDDKQIGLWSAADGRRVKILPGVADGATCLALSPDGEAVAVGTDGGVVRIWRISDGRILNELRTHTGGVGAVGFSLDGRKLLTAGADGRVRLWRATDGRLERDGKLPEGAGERVVAVGGGVVALLTPGVGEELVLRSAEGGHEVGRVRLPGEKIVAGALSPDGLTAAVLSEKGGARLVRLGDGTVLQSYPALRGDMIGVGPGGGTLISGSRGGLVRVWR